MQWVYSNYMLVNVVNVYKNRVLHSKINRYTYAVCSPFLFWGWGGENWIAQNEADHSEAMIPST